MKKSFLCKKVIFALLLGNMLLTGRALAADVIWYGVNDGSGHTDTLPSYTTGATLHIYGSESDLKSVTKFYGAYGDFCQNDKIIIDGGMFGDNVEIYGAYSTSSANDNCQNIFVTINGGYFGADTKIGLIYSTRPQGSGVRTLTIGGTAGLDLSKAELIGNYSSGPGNCGLEIARTNIKIKHANKFSKLIISYSPPAGSSFDPEKVFLSTSTAVNLSDNFSTIMYSSAPSLATGDYVVIVDNVTSYYSGGSTNYEVLSVPTVADSNHKELVYKNGSDSITPKSDYTIVQGSNKWNSDQNNGSGGNVYDKDYSSQNILGNPSSISGLLPTSPVPNSDSYTNNTVIVRRGKYYSASIKGADNSAGSATSDLTNNKVLVYGGTFKSATICGAEDKKDKNVNYNTVEISNIALADRYSDVYGGKAYYYDGSSATGQQANYNTVVMGDGIVLAGVDTVECFRTVYGGQGLRGASNNKVTILSGRYNSEIFGGEVAFLGSGDALNNVVEINGGTMWATRIVGGKTKSGFAGNTSGTGNTVIIKNTIFPDGIVVTGGHSENGKANYNSIVLGDNIIGSPYYTSIYGGYGSSGAAYNEVTIKSGLYNSVEGGDGGDGDVENNTLTFTGGTIMDSAHIIGGKTKSGNAANNKLDISGVIIETEGSYASASKFIGGESESGSAGTTSGTGNTVNISNITVNGNVGCEVYGGLGYSESMASPLVISGTQANYNMVTMGSDIKSTNNGYFAAVYGGRGNTGAEHNTVSIASGTYDKVYGGRTVSGNSDYNMVTIIGGNFKDSAAIYGGFTESATDSASNNIVEIAGGTYGTGLKICGGRTSAGGTFDDNTLNLKIKLDNVQQADCFKTVNFTLPSGMTTNEVMLNISGGTPVAMELQGMDFTTNLNGVSLAADDYVTLVKNVDDTGFTPAAHYAVFDINGTKELVYYTGFTVPEVKSDYRIYEFGQAVYNAGVSASAYTADIKGNRVGAVYNGNKVEVIRGTYNTDIYGAKSTDQNVAKNTVVINDGTFTGKIYGGYSDSGMTGGDSDTDGNVVTVKGGTFNNNVVVAGGYSYSGAVKHNTVIVEGGTFNGTNVEIYGGQISTGTAEQNKVIIKNGTFTNVTIYGGGGTGTTSNNMVEIAGGNFTVTGTGIDGGISNNNVLNMKMKMSSGSGVGYVKHFNTFNFTLPSGTVNGDTMLRTNLFTVDESPTGGGTINVSAASGVSLPAGSIITLVDATGGSITGDFAGGTILGITAVSTGTAGEYKAGDNILTIGAETITLYFGESVSDKSAVDGDTDMLKSPVEGIVASVAMVNQGADLAMGDGMSSLLTNTAGGSTDTFAASTVGKSKYKTGSHVDMDGWNIVAGVGNAKNWTDGDKTTYGVFFEYGKGDFDTYNNNIHGKGDSKATGGGVLIRQDDSHGSYYEACVRYGKVETDWSQSDIGGYNADSRYHGVSAAYGYLAKCGINKWDNYIRYTYGHTSSVDVRLAMSDYHVESVKSHRLRLGTKYMFGAGDGKKTVVPYFGLAWEHEFNGDVKAIIAGFGSAPAPTLRGNTGIMEFGVNIEKGKFTLSLGGEAYIAVYCDATYIPLKRNTVQKEALHVLLGITPDGRKEVLDYAVAANENNSTYRQLLKNIKERGVEEVLLFVTDGFGHLGMTCNEVFPKAKHQCCWVHVSRNIRAYVRKSDWNVMAEEVKGIYTADNKEQATDRMGEYLRKWYSKYPKLWEKMYDPEELFAFMILPERIRKSFYTTNALEGLNNILKRQTRKKEMFPNENSMERFVCAVYENYNEGQYFKSALPFEETSIEVSQIFDEVYGAD